MITRIIYSMHHFEWMNLESNRIELITYMSQYTTTVYRNNLSAYTISSIREVNESSTNFNSSAIQFSSVTHIESINITVIRYKTNIQEYPYCSLLLFHQQLSQSILRQHSVQFSSTYNKKSYYNYKYCPITNLSILKFKPAKS